MLITGTTFRDYVSSWKMQNTCSTNTKRCKPHNFKCLIATFIFIMHVIVHVILHCTTMLVSIQHNLSTSVSSTVPWVLEVILIALFPSAKSYIQCVHDYSIMIKKQTLYSSRYTIKYNHIIM